MAVGRNMQYKISENRDKIEVQYEPYLCTLKIIQCSIELNNNSRTNLIINKNKGKSLYIWGEDLIKSIGEDFNSKSFEIIFKGRKEEFEDLEDVLDKFNETGWKIGLNFIEISENKNILQDFENYLEEIEKSDIKKVKSALEKNNVREKFNDVKNSIAEIGVIATMSSGKSTLINAMIGKEILPSRNEACTATIFKLENDKLLSEYLYRTETKNNEPLTEWESIDIKELEKLNNNQNERTNIRIKGDFPGIDDNEMKIVFVDTPGPNSARNVEHKEITFNFVKDNMNNPLVLYVLNATQLATNDDASLLNGIAESMKKNGKQAEERFIFALNKIDNINPEEESLEEMVERTKAYLAEFGIKNPKIFPVSAGAAKLCRKKTIENLTTEETEEYENYIFKFFPDDCYEGIKTFENSSLPERLKKEILDKINNSVDINETLLHYSGITAIELYINRYITKYTKSLKVKTAIETTKQTIDFIHSELNMLRGRTEEELNQLSEEIKNVEIGLKGREKERIESLKSKINSLEIYEMDFIKLVGQIGKMFLEIEEEFDKEEVSVNRAKAIFKYANKMIEIYYADLKTSVVNISIEQLHNKVDEIINTLKSFYIEEFNKIPKAEELKKILEQQLILDLPNTAEMIEYGFYTKKEKRWRTETRFVGVKKKRKLLNPLSWFWPDEENIYEEVSIPEYETKQYVNLREVRDFYINGIKLKLRKQIEKVENKLANILEIIKNEALKSIDALEKQVETNLNEMQKKVEKQKSLAGNYEEIEREFEKINTIKEKIEKILEN